MWIYTCRNSASEKLIRLLSYLVSDRFQDLNQCRQSTKITVISVTMHNSPSKTRLQTTYSKYKDSPISWWLTDW